MSVAKKDFCYQSKLALANSSKNDIDLFITSRQPKNQMVATEIKGLTHWRVGEIGVFFYFAVIKFMIKCPNWVCYIYVYL